MRSFFAQKKPSVFRKCGVYLPSANAEDEITKKNKKKLSDARLEPGIAILPSTALTTTPSCFLLKVSTK